MIRSKKPFNLQDYLADKSQKVVTRDGRCVRIICTDAVIHSIPSHKNKQTLALITEEDGEESLGYYFSNGHQWIDDSASDLFLVTEDEPMTEFEEAVQQAIQDSEFNEDVCNKLLSLARKQLKAEGWEYTDPLLKEIMEERVPKTEETGTRDEHFDDLFDDYYDKNWEDGMSLEQCAKHFYNLGKAEALKEQKPIVMNTPRYSPPEQKPEWSEEDEENMKLLEVIFEKWSEGHAGRITRSRAKEMLTWLKSLKNRGNSPKSNTNSPKED